MRARKAPKSQELTNPQVFMRENPCAFSVTEPGVQQSCIQILSLKCDLDFQFTSIRNLMRHFLSFKELKWGL